jgi:hypothetical protein
MFNSQKYLEQGLIINVSINIFYRILRVGFQVIRAFDDMCTTAKVG